ncbi:MAG: SRPBCC family protein [Saprospiraceae bacterium]|nr:SRPBCC family protein [Saprospiraceae bacterium]
MKILKILLFILLGLVALVVLLGLFAKKDYHIERSIEVEAPKDLVYEHYRYFKNGKSWSPWAHLDPNMKESFEGTDGEVGAVHKWSGNDDVGEGQQTITAMTPDRIDTEVKFIRPFESTAPRYMLFKGEGKKTQLTWAFDMHIAFPWNGFAMFTDMNAGVGGDYERGLKNLKKVCEEIAHNKYRGFEVAELEIPMKYYVGTRKTVPFAEIPVFFGAHLPLAMEAVLKGGATLAGAPSGLFWNYDEQAGTTDMAATIPIAASQKFGNALSVFNIGGQRALQIDYYGPYEKTGEAHLGMDEYMAEKGLQSIPPVVEEYITDPGKEPDTAKWLTRIIYFVEPKPQTN